MKGTAHWQGFYQTLVDGRSQITTAALLAFTRLHPERSIDMDYLGRPAKVLLLDKPLRLAEGVPESEMNEIYLARIKINELPGWPPKLASTVFEHRIPPFLECVLKRISHLKAGPVQGGLVYSLAYEDQKLQAWQVDCPAELLRCAEATLKQAGMIGMKLRDLQHVRLIGAG